MIIIGRISLILSPCLDQSGSYLMDSKVRNDELSPNVNDVRIDNPLGDSVELSRSSLLIHSGKCCEALEAFRGAHRGEALVISDSESTNVS